MIFADGGFGRLLGWSDPVSKWRKSIFGELNFKINLIFSRSQLDHEHQAGGHSLWGRVPVLVLDLRVSISTKSGNGMLLYQQWRLQVKVVDHNINADRNLDIVVKAMKIGKLTLYHRIAIWIITKVNHDRSGLEADCTISFENFLFRTTSLSEGDDENYRTTTEPQNMFR